MNKEYGKKNNCCFLVAPHVRGGKCTLSWTRRSDPEELYVEKTLVSASLIKVTLWKKVCMRSVQAWISEPGRGGPPEEVTNTWLSVQVPFPSLCPPPAPKDFLEAEQSLSKLNSQLSTWREVYCSANWNILDFQQQTQGMSQGLRKEEDPKNIYF